MIRVTADVTASSWESLFEEAEEATAYNGWADGELHGVEVSGGSVTYGGLRVKVAELGDPEAIERGLVKPIISLVNHHRRGPAAS